MLTVVWPRFRGIESSGTRQEGVIFPIIPELRSKATSLLIDKLGFFGSEMPKLRVSGLSKTSLPLVQSLRWFEVCCRPGFLEGSASERKLLNMRFTGPCLPRRTSSRRASTACSSEGHLACEVLPAGGEDSGFLSGANLRKRCRPAPGQKLISVRIRLEFGG